MPWLNIPGYTVSSQNICSGIFLQEYLWLEVYDTDTGDTPQIFFLTEERVGGVMKNGQS